MSTAADDAESVDQFLARIASLKDRRDREDEERIRKVEEEILQGRKNRQARRAERARSLSPAKSSPAPSSSATIETKATASRPMDPPVGFAPPSRTQTPTRSPMIEPAQSPHLATELSDVQTTRALPTPPQKASSTPAPTPPTATSLARSGTLSWQQRPSSRDSNTSRIRPFSGSPASTHVSNIDPEEEMSRSQIAKSLGSKDPAFFRQTADRSLGSAAYRRTESERDSESSTHRSMRLPGMSREQSLEPDRSTGLDFEFAKPQLPAHNARIPELARLDGPTSTAPSHTSTPIQSSPLSTPRLAPVESLVSDEKPTETSSAAFPGWGTSRRPQSPTKGLGGFVESAMMKRSDSLSKRWSVQAAPGLKRGDSVASNRTVLDTTAGGPSLLNASKSPPRPTRPIRPLSSSSPAGSRPTSRHGMSSSISELALTSEASSLATPSNLVETENHANTKDIELLDGPASRPKVSVTSADHVLDDMLPVSPTKTMDSRRWSPTKSSWLESALARPESPKTVPSKLDEPAWKAGMQKAKGSIGSAPSANYEVNTTGLLRSPPMGGHSKPLSISGLPDSFTSDVLKKSPGKPRPATTTGDPKLKALEPTVLQGTEGVDLADIRATSTTESVKSLPAKPPGESGPFAFLPVSTAKRDPPVVKAKPAAPKTDFRSNLSSRQQSSEDNASGEPEFKAVFGKLKRTQTKNYVPPDELKDNITRGKAALNLTGGPQKTKRVDEFKESILQKKEAIKEVGGLAPKPSLRDKPAPVVPEALAKKEAMKAGAVLTTKPQLSEKPSPAIPEALAKRQLLSKFSSTGSGTKITPFEPTAEPVKMMHQAEPVVRKPEPATNKEIEDPSLPREEVAEMRAKQRSAPPKPDLANNKLASRLNPALARFLSRGSSPKTSNNNSPAASTEELSLMPRGLSRKATNESEEVGGAALTHMTKARAKGPKRRAPRPDALTEAAVERSAQEMEVEVAPAAIPNADITKDARLGTRPLPTPARGEPAVNDPRTPKPLAEILKAQNRPDQQESNPINGESILIDTPKERPAIVAKSPELRKISAPTPKPAVGDAPPSAIKDRMRAFDIAQDQPNSSSSKPDTYIGGWNNPSTTSPIPSPLAPSTTKLNSPRSPSTSIISQQKPPVTKFAKPPSGLGLNLTASNRKEVAPSVAELTPPPEKPLPLSIKKDLPGKTNAAAENDKRATVQPQRESKAQAHFADFFDQAPKASDKADFDTPAIMSPNAASNQRMKTLSMSVWEITGSGKKEPLPAQQEHILFEDSLYLCVHAFQSENGSKTTEAHLWVGGAVSEAAVEDAQLFCRKIARENSAKLEVLQQGKETASFFQALGGIVITRRSKHSALYMLCGRRHLGHIAFDEVDLVASSLCSGFPYIVSAKFSRLFLWKGRGSGADELGCARLIGMDLGLTGEIEEINEGEEPKAFWESFASKTRSQSSDLWDLKSTQDAYSCRLYRVEMDRPKSATGFWGRRGSSPPKSSNRALIEEISPFCQGDLHPGHVFVLDAYFEVYVYVGDQASSKTAEFVTALMLAQEISMLAPTLQDRPLMPACRVVFGDPPKDFKAVLRKWEDERYEKSMVLPLDEAIDALG